MSNMKMSAEDVTAFWRNVSLRHIEIIFTVARIGSVTEAASILNMSAAGVSRTCQRFESHFQFPIFEKKRKGIRFSPEGKCLIEELRPLYDCIVATSDRLSSYPEPMVIPNSD